MNNKTKAMRKIIDLMLIVFFILSTIVSCRNHEMSSEPDVHATTDRDIQEINNCRERYVSAWMTGNADSITTLYTDEAVVPGRTHRFHEALHTTS